MTAYEGLQIYIEASGLGRLAALPRRDLGVTAAELVGEARSE